MTTAAEDHYENFLAQHYTWMSGGYEIQIKRNLDSFSDIGLVSVDGGKALDLGCGSGYQSLALAALGYDVLAVDSSQMLLTELSAQSAATNIRTIQGNMFDTELITNNSPFDVVVCMGDSLLHASNVDSVRRLFGDINRNLDLSGKFVVSFRDLSHELQGIERLIPVRLDEDKLMAAFLEYSETHVDVHDMIFAKDSGRWEMSKSAYKKLRLSADVVNALLIDSGFSILSHSIERGFVTFCSVKV